MRFHHQLAAYSPLTPHAIFHAGLGAVGFRAQSRNALRRRLLELYDADECILVGSGTQALEYAIRMAAADRSTNALVALPAFTCYDVASAAIGAGVRVALYDIDPLTLSPDLDSLERVMAAGASIAVMTPLYGIPFNWKDVEALGRRYGVSLIEDAAQGHGATWRSTPLGALGAVSTVSFGRGKGWTGGAGGAVLLRPNTPGLRPELSSADALRNLRLVGGLVAQWALGRPEVYGIPRSIPALALGETIYHAPTALGEMPAAAVGSAAANETASRDEAEVRRRNASWFLAALEDSRASTIRVPPEGSAGYLRFPLLVEGGLPSLPAHATELGVAQSYPTTLAELPPLMQRLVRVDSSWPGADRLSRELITFPTHSRVTSRERSALVELVSR